VRRPSGEKHPRRLQRVRRRRAASHAAGAPLSVNVGPVRARIGAAGEVIAAARTPGSPSYGHYLTEPEYLASYAPTDAQVAAVESLARQPGPAGDRERPGQPARVRAGLHRSCAVAPLVWRINDYSAAGRDFYAKRPGSLRARRPDRCRDHRPERLLTNPWVASTCFSTICGDTGNDYRAAYNLTGKAEGPHDRLHACGANRSRQKPTKTTPTITKTPELKIGAGHEHIEFIELGGASSVNNTNEIALDTEPAHVVAARGPPRLLPRQGKPTSPNWKRRPTKPPTSAPR